LIAALVTKPLLLMKVAVVLREKVNRESSNDIWVKSRDSVEPSPLVNMPGR
jgi:hypothetical protein